MMNWTTWNEKQAWSKFTTRDEAFEDEAEAYGAMDAPEWMPAGGCEASVFNPGEAWPIIIRRG